LAGSAEVFYRKGRVQQYMPPHEQVCSLSTKMLDNRTSVMLS
jgi:hypothetical protein